LLVLEQAATAARARAQRTGRAALETKRGERWAAMEGVM
ncbi:MAG: hypothetical protein ACI80K_002880, partial [Paracoccaceae bacterium]